MKKFRKNDKSHILLIMYMSETINTKNRIAFNYIFIFHDSWRKCINLILHSDHFESNESRDIGITDNQFSNLS